jgi:hypothetical protein
MSIGVWYDSIGRRVGGQQWGTRRATFQVWAEISKYRVSYISRSSLSQFTKCVVTDEPPDCLEDLDLLEDFPWPSRRIAEVSANSLCQISIEVENYSILPGSKSHCYMNYMGRPNNC